MNNQSTNYVLKRNLNYSHGTAAQPIYEECCRKFGWDYGARGKFGKQQKLYARCATKEGYSPWFIANSNFTKTEGGVWRNRIYQNIIEETWDVIDPYLFSDDTTRVVFAKNSRHEYVFIGVYELFNTEKKTNSMGKSVGVKYYRLISDTYPIATECDV